MKCTVVALFRLPLTVLLFFFSFQFTFSQEETNSWLPKSVGIDLDADGKIGFGKVQSGFSANEIRLRSNITLHNNNRVVAVFKSRVPADKKWDDWDSRINRLSEIYFQYSDNYRVFERNLTVNAQVGKLEWFPRITDPRQILDNINLFIDPPNYYGGNLFLDYHMLPQWRVSGHFTGTTGDVINDNEKANVRDAFLRINPEFIKDFGVNISTGKFQATKYAFNEAYAYYSPLLYERVRLDLRAGKLPGLDATPYGGRIGIEGQFEYIAVGGYFEQRLNQNKKERLLGFYWRILKPDELVNVLNTFHLLYDTDNDILRFIIPVFSITFK